jgi:curved DNA-binding protein CbpA
MKNYYKILQIDPSASARVIKMAYKAMVQEYHPDTNSEDPTLTEKMKDIGEAYEVLSDPHKRLAYDEALKYTNAECAEPPPNSSTGNPVNHAPDSVEKTVKSKPPVLIKIIIAVLVLGALVVLLRSGPESHTGNAMNSTMGNTQATAQMHTDHIDWQQSPEHCGVSGFCSFKITDDQGNTLLEGMSFAEPKFLSTVHDGHYDVVTSIRTYQNDISPSGEIQFESQKFQFHTTNGKYEAEK